MVAGTGCLLLTACQHGPDELVAPEPSIRTVEQHLAVDLRYGGHTYELASIYTDAFGHAFKLDTIRFLLSGAHAVSDDGATLADYPDAYLLVDGADTSNDFTLGTLTSDHLHGIRFMIGLEPAVNHIAPANAPAPMNNGSMFSGNTSTGYRFLELMGRADSNGDGAIDMSDQPFAFHCGGDAMLRSSSAPVHTDLPTGGSFTARLPVDVEKLLTNIDFLNTPSSTGDGPINAQLMDQLVEAMIQEH